MLIKRLILNTSIKRFHFKALIMLTTLVLLSGLSCGKRKPPLPPIERVPQRVQITGFQRGNKIELKWQMPARNAPDGSILNISRVEVYRLAEPLNSSLTLSEEEFASRSTLINSFPVKDTDFALKTLSYADTLEFAGQLVRLRYAIRFTNAAGQRAAFSNYLLIEPTAKVANFPIGLDSKVSQDSIFITWAAPETNIDNSKPVNVLGYNIYRKTGDADFVLLNKAPVNKSEFADEFFEFGKDYKYFVRTVSLGSNSEPIESLDSKVIEVSPKDTFAPSAPTAITIAAAPDNISIFFAINPEKDIAGYKIYRTEDQNIPKQNWKLLTTEAIATNTYQDKDVQSGKTYYYYLIAIDKTGNQSEPSEVVSETAP